GGAADRGERRLELVRRVGEQLALVLVRPRERHLSLVVHQEQRGGCDDEQPGERQRNVEAAGTDRTEELGRRLCRDRGPPADAVLAERGDHARAVARVLDESAVPRCERAQDGSIIELLPDPRAITGRDQRACGVDKERAPALPIVEALVVGLAWVVVGPEVPDEDRGRLAALLDRNGQRHDRDARYADDG